MKRCLWRIFILFFTITFHETIIAQDECDLSKFVTFTKGGWGSEANGNNPGVKRDALFPLAFPQGLTAGIGNTIKLTSSQSAAVYLRGGGTPDKLTHSYTDPVTTESGILGIQIAALKLNVAYDAFMLTKPVMLTELVIAKGKFAGKTVAEFLLLAEAALGGADISSSGYTYSDINEAATAINENFDNGTLNKGFLTCPEPSQTDLEVIKTASKTSVQCGEDFSYTITVKNIGPNQATAVTIKDILPLEAEYVSSSASQGAYDPKTGEWTPGSLDAEKSASLTINVRVNCTEQESKSNSLGTAGGFNVFALEDMTQPSADTQGKVAVGGNANFANYSVGDLLPPKSGDVLIVGGSLNYISGSINNGNAVYGGTTNLPQSAVSITGGTLRQDHPIDFAAAKEYLEGLSLELAGHLPNGQSRFMWGSLSLTGNDPVLNVFNVSGSDLSAANNFEIEVPKGSSVLVNISGQNVNWSGGMSLLGAAVSDVIYNFFQAQGLKIIGIEVRGTVLAPFAALDYPSGLVTGEMIAKSVTGSGQFNNDPWDGELPEDEETPDPKSFTNTASLSGSIPEDNNPENNSSGVTVSIGLPSGITERENVPDKFTLRQNYPNPFNPSTTIEFAVPSAGRYSIKVFNMLGQEVTTLLERDLQSGHHRIVFDASKIPSGIYIYRLSGSNVHLIRKMVLAK